MGISTTTKLLIGIRSFLQSYHKLIGIIEVMVIEIKIKSVRWHYFLGIIQFSSAAAELCASSFLMNDGPGPAVHGQASSY